MLRLRSRKVLDAAASNVLGGHESNVLQRPRCNVRAHQARCMIPPVSTLCDPTRRTLRDHVLAPFFLPRFPFVFGYERHDAVLRKRGAAGAQPREKAGEVRVVAGDEHIARLRAEAIAHPLGGILRLQIPRRGELRERIARAPERLRRLLCAELAAVPHDLGLYASRCGAGREALDSTTAASRRADAAGRRRGRRRRRDGRG